VIRKRELGLTKWKGVVLNDTEIDGTGDPW
jgi:hypothetical protein